MAGIDNVFSKKDMPDAPVFQMPAFLRSRYRANQHEDIRNITSFF